MDYKKVLLLHFTQGLSGRSIAEVTGVSKSAINEFLKRFRESKELYYPLPEDVPTKPSQPCFTKKQGILPQTFTRISTLRMYTGR